MQKFLTKNGRKVRFGWFPTMPKFGRSLLPIEKRCKQTNGHVISTVKRKELEIRLSKWRAGIKYLSLQFGIGALEYDFTVPIYVHIRDMYRHREM